MRCGRWIPFTLLWLILFLRPCLAQSGPNQGVQSQEALQAVQQFSSCLRALAFSGEKPPPGLSPPEQATRSEFERMRLDSDRIVNGLVSDWGKMPQDQALARMPAEYLAHLQAATTLCQGTLGQARTSRRPVTSVALALARDLALKVDDCRKFDMGRMIPVEIRVIRAGVPDIGWSVFYKWLPGSEATTVTELPFPAPTPGAVRALPAGLYVVRGEKSDNGKTIRTAPSTVPVGGTDRITFSITAP